MSKSTKKKVIKELQPRDIAILKGLYEYRALSTEQIMQGFRISKWYTYKKISALRNSGYIITEQIRGYNPHQCRQGNYHRISETGIGCLQKQGYPVERRAYDLRVRIRHLPFLLMTNEIMITLSQANWTTKDSREVKKQYGLNRGVNVQGILTNPCNKDHVLYTFLENTSVKSLEKIAAEINTHMFTDYLFLARGGGSYKSIINRFTDSDAMLKCQSFKVFPRGLGKDYLRAFDGCERQFNTFLEETYKDCLSFKIHFKRIKEFDGLIQVVNHQGEEKYLVNLLDTDLVKVYNIKKYRKENYKMDGRKVLLITEPNLRPIHEDLLKSIHHIDYLELTQEDIKHAIKQKLEESQC